MIQITEVAGEQTFGPSGPSPPGTPTPPEVPYKEDNDYSNHNLQQFKQSPGINLTSQGITEWFFSTQIHMSSYYGT